MRSLAIVLALAGLAHAGADPIVGTSTGIARSAPSPQATLHLGGDGPSFVLYFRTDEPLGPAQRAVLTATLGVLARIPGAHVELYLEPIDRNSATLAQALVDLPDEGSRRSLLFALAEQHELHVLDLPALLRFERSVGLPISQHIGRALPSAPARALLRRPPDLPLPGAPFLALGSRIIDSNEVDRLAAVQVWPVASRRDRDLARALYAGDPLAPRQAILRVSLPVSVSGRNLLVSMLPLHDQGRLRLRLELATALPGRERRGEMVLRRIFGNATPADRVRLARALLTDDLPAGVADDEAAAIWLAQSAGVDPASLLDPVPATPGESNSTSTAFAIDGMPAPTLERLNRPPSLRQRLAGPDDLP